MTTSSYLEHFLNSLDSLPGELRRNFTLMHDLDTRNKAILQDADAASDDYLRKVGELNADKRRAEAEKIQKMFKKAKGYGDEKVSIALQTYEMVDKHIRRLDADLAKFEAEMREKGRLSQTESEEDDAEQEEDQQQNQQANEGKKRGRKKGSGSKEAAASSAKKKKKTGKGGGSATPSGAADEEKGAGGGRKKSKKSGAAGASSSSSGQKGDGTAASSSSSSQKQLLSAIPQEIIDMPVDPNEPTYCLCQQVSYGEMIGCDNNDCPIEWFHFGCMSLTTKPKGKWYCPKCQSLFKKKKGT